MRAGQVLQGLIAECLARLDARLVRRLLGAIDALVASRQVVLMELARQYPGAPRVAAPLKALDRLLSNPRVQRARQALYAAGLQRLWPLTATVVVAIDWCTLKRDESLHLLRAALPVGGRALPVWDEVHPQAKLAHPRVHTGFLATLRRLLPLDALPILITDAGFGVPWFKSAESLGFACIGRLRGLTQIRPVGEADWAATGGFDELGSGRIVDLGVCEIGKTRRHRARVVVCKNPPKGRKHRDARRRIVQGSGSRAHARSAREAWVLIASTALDHLSALQVVQHYARRMQIEESFRDLKDPRHGAALRHSLTRVAARLEVLILLHALASIAAWLRAQIARRDGEHLRLLAHPQAARRTTPTLSLWRIGWEVLKRGWPPHEPPEAPLPVPSHPLQLAVAM